MGIYRPGVPIISMPRTKPNKWKGYFKAGAVGFIAGASVFFLALGISLLVHWIF
jgi:hypothetical protein